MVADESANGSTVCVVRGSELIILLRASANGDWSNPRVVGDALGPGGGIPTPANKVGWLFTAVATGTAQVSLSRSNCPTASPGIPSCPSPVAFRLRVNVR